MFMTDFLSPSLTTAQKNEINRQYAQSLMGKSTLPSGEEERSWLYAQFERTQNVADAVPDDRSAQLRAAIMLANFGRNAEAVERVENLVKQHPDFCNAHLILGGIYHYLGRVIGHRNVFDQPFLTPVHRRRDLPPI